MKIKKLQLLIFTLILLTPIVSKGESGYQINVLGDIRPINTVTLQLISPYRDIGGIKVFWLEDNVLMDEGIGMTTHQIDLGPLGSSVTVTAVLGIPGTDGSEKATLTLSPATTDLLWEAQTVVPPFFKGKAMPSHESLIKTLAIPNFGTTTPSSLVKYTWKKNKTILIGDGININSAGLFGAWENTSDTVSVSANYDGKTASAEVKIPSFVPSLQFYEISPTQGILTHESLNGSPYRNEMEISLLATPFGFSSADLKKSKIQYKWMAGKKEIKKGVGSEVESITLTRNGNSLKTGEVVISLLVENIVNVMQFKESKFSWKFTQN